MEHKIWVNSSIITILWKKIVSRVFIMIGCFCLVLPLVLAIAIAGILWLVSFGHIVLVKTLTTWLDLLFQQADKAMGISD